MTPETDFSQRAAIARADLAKRIAARRAFELGTDPEPKPPYQKPEFWTADTPACRIAADLEDGGYTSRVAGSDFDRVVEATLDLLSGAIVGLVITGRTGCGKTTAARIIAAKALDRFHPPATPMPEVDPQTFVIRALRVRAASEPDLDALRTTQASRNVYIDDLGYDRPILFFGNRCDAVADFVLRWGDTEGRRGKLVVTTNLDAAGIKSRYDDRVLSRLIDRCGWRSMAANDHRIDNLRKY